MGFIETFFKKNAIEITKKDIEDFISRKIEENLNLDYKNIHAFNDFDELSKDVSAFANSEGGILILGISEEIIGRGKNLKIVPKDIIWGDEFFSKEQLEDNLIGKIRPRIIGLHIYPIREGNGSLRVIFLIDIPQSDNPPHMASDNRYYRRMNFRRVLMEHYEISDLFGRRRKPFLYLVIELLEVKLEDSSYNFKVRFLLGNSGKAIAKYVRFVATFTNLEIVSSDRAEKFRRIDFLRRGKPSLQYDSGDGIFYPILSLTSIGDYTFKVQDSQNPIKIAYSLIAENMDYFYDEIVFNISTLQESQEIIKKGTPSYIKL